MLVPLNIPPGVKRAGTLYQSKGRWYDTNLVRWFEGSMRPIGGWQPLALTSGAQVTLTGVPRAAHSWRANGGLEPWLAVGTTSKIYVYSQGVLTDITETGTTAGPPNSSGTGPYGTGFYGIGPYGGSGGSSNPGGGAPLVVAENATWTLDNFGDFLTGVLSSDGKLRFWDRNIANKMVQVDAVNAPINNRAVVVTPERFVLLLGAGGNARKVQWPNQETMNAWNPTAETTAGDFDLTTNGRLMNGKRTTRETLLWTDTELWAAIYIGGTLVYSFEPRGASCGAISPNSMAVIGDGAMWMSDQGFFRYDGSASKIPCEVFDYIFTRLNKAQKLKTYAVPNTQFGEICWYYVSINSNEIDSYVIYNWLEDKWYFGSMSRTCGVDRDVFPFPILTTSAGLVFEHERGSLRTGEEVFAESGPFEVGDGNNVLMLRHIYPDERAQGEVEGFIMSRFHANGTEITSGPYQMGQPTAVRVTGRQVRIRIREKTANTDWRVGNFRFEAEKAGER